MWKVAWSKLLFSKFQENHVSKLIELPITKNAQNSAILYANKSNHGKKKTEWTASRRNIMEEAHGGVVFGPLFTREKFLC